MANINSFIHFRNKGTFTRRAILLASTAFFCTSLVGSKALASDSETVPTNQVVEKVDREDYLVKQSLDKIKDPQLRNQIWDLVASIAPVKNWTNYECYSFIDLVRKCPAKKMPLIAEALAEFLSDNTWKVHELSYLMEPLCLLPEANIRPVAMAVKKMASSTSTNAYSYGSLIEITSDVAVERLDYFK